MEPYRTYRPTSYSLPRTHAWALQVDYMRRVIALLTVSCVERLVDADSAGPLRILVGKKSRRNGLYQPRVNVSLLQMTIQYRFGRMAHCNRMRNGTEVNVFLL